jgi:hypothetical protein
LEKAAKHGAQHGVKIKKMWDSADGYGASDKAAYFHGNVAKPA